MKIVYREASTLARDLGIPLNTLYAVSYRRWILVQFNSGLP